MTEDNYITIQGWMRTDLDLKGNDLLVYAIIYGFSQAENQEFTGSLQYLADWCGATKQGISNNLKRLCERGLIKKTEEFKNGVKFCKYSCIVLNKVVYPIKQSLTNNTNDIIEKDKVLNNKLFNTVEAPKKSLYDKCLALIDEFNDAVLREMLVKFLQTCLQNAREGGTKFYTNNFKGKLNQLKALSNDNYTQRKIVQQSIDKGWSNFYEIKSEYNRSEKAASAKSVDYTQDELDRLAEQDEERRRNGERTVF